MRRWMRRCRSWPSCRRASRSCSASTCSRASPWTSLPSPATPGCPAVLMVVGAITSSSPFYGAGAEELQAAALVPRHQPGRLHDPRHRHRRCPSASSAGCSTWSTTPCTSRRLFLTGGAVEKQAGTTDLESSAAWRAACPSRSICFLVAAASISGVPPFNGFFSKEMVYDAALERGWCSTRSLLGSFFTAASFLKLGHAAFFGKRSEANRLVKEAPLPMLIPMMVLAGLCILFGVANSLPLSTLIVPAVGMSVTGGRTVRRLSRQRPPGGADGRRPPACGPQSLVRRAAERKRPGAADHIHYALPFAPSTPLRRRGSLTRTSSAA